MREAETAVTVAAAADTFVGRKQLIEQLAAAPPRGAARIVDASGIAGMGKTALIRRLEQKAAEWPGRVHVLPIDVDEATSPSTVTQAWDAFRALIRHQAAQLFGRDLGSFENELKAAETRRLLGDIHTLVHADHADIGSGANVGGVRLDDAVAELLVGPKVENAASAFVSRFAPLVKNNATLVTIDGFDWIAASAYARWLVSLLGRLPNTLVVITRSPGAAAPGLAGVAVERKELERFSREEIAELLAGSPPEQAVDPRLVEIVHEWSAGHVFTAALAARYLRTLDDADPAAFRARLEALPADYDEQRAKIALEILRAPGAADLADTACALAVTRRFDADLFEVLGRPEPLPVPADKAIQRLQRAGLVEPADPGYYRIHSFLREPLERQLGAERRRQLHRNAADHYYEHLTADEPELGASALAYDDWYRYEKPEWQAQLREWLYHSRGAAKDDRERERVRLQFARVFLDAFWWWGCYVPFPFCSDLIADWRRARSDDADWAEDLELLLDGYPTGYRKQGAGRWHDVRTALVRLRTSCGLDGDADAIADGDARHTRALLDNFLAHSFRYATPSSDAERAKWYRQALDKYDEAARLFERGDETWELAWTLFERAELHADNGELGPAREGWREAVAVALDEDDWELKANLHRLAADIGWSDGTAASVFDAHGRAVLHAYLFQCKTASHRPDAYTVTFYWEQVERAFERLQGLDAAALEDAAARLAAPFGGPQVDVAAVAAAVAEPAPRRLAGLVFPEAPKDDELLEVRSGFTSRVHLLAEELAPERDLEDVKL